VRVPFRRTVVFENLGRVRLGEGEARMRLYPSRRGLVSVLAGGVGYEKGHRGLPEDQCPRPKGEVNPK